MKYKVTKKGPIDLRQPGDDVTGLYDDETMARLVDDGYVEAETPRKPKRSKAARKVTDA